MFKTIITLTLILISFTSKANQELPRYGEPVKPFYNTAYGEILGQTGQKAKASIITCKMAKYNSIDIYHNDDLIPNLKFEMRPVGVRFGGNGEKWKFGHVVIKKNGQVVKQLMPERDYLVNGPFASWGEGYIDGSTHIFGNGWAVNYNTYENNGGLYIGDVETFAKHTPRYALIQCNSGRSHSLPVFDIGSSRAQFDLKNIDPL